MKLFYEKESIDVYSTKFLEIVNQIWKYNEDVSKQNVVEKILGSLPKKHEHIVVAIKEAKDLSKLSFDELLGSLQSHKDKVK